MSRLGRYKIPREFKDEDKWFKFFTKKQLFYLVIFGGLAVGAVWLTSNIHLTLLGILLAIFLIAIGIVVPRVNMPLDKYLWGGGVPIEKLAVRVLLKQLPKNKVVYISNVDKGN